MLVGLDLLSHDDLGFSWATEDFSIQKIVSKGTFKAFTKTILPRATGVRKNTLASNLTGNPKFPVSALKRTLDGLQSDTPSHPNTLPKGSYKMRMSNYRDWRCI